MVADNGIPPPSLHSQCVPKYLLQELLDEFTRFYNGQNSDIYEGQPSEKLKIVQKMRMILSGEVIAPSIKPEKAS